MQYVIKNYFFLCILLAFTCETEQNRCDNQILYKVLIKDDNDVNFYKEMKQNALIFNLTFDREVRFRDTVAIFRTSECEASEINKRLRIYGVDSFEAEPLSEFKRRILLQKPMDGIQFDPIDEEFDFDVVAKRYLSSNEIDGYVMKFVEEMNDKYPNIITKINLEGYSHQGRPIYSVYVGYRGRKNPIVLIDAGIHAREWHSRSLALYTLRQLLNEADLDVDGMLFTTTIIVVPNVNPDGYEHSLNVFPMWRKTMREVGDGCVGVDGNRNFDIYWSLGTDEKFPCREVYKGEMPFSEKETQIIRDLMIRYRSNCIMYITFHTFGNTIIYPYGHSNSKHPKKAVLHRVASAGVEAVHRRTGTKFIASQSGTQLYLAAGGSEDYAMDVVGIPLAFTLELGPENYGFFVPVGILKKTVLDGWIVVQAMIEEAKAVMNYRN